MCRVGSRPGEKTIGASTKARKINPPSQTTSDSSMKKRRNDMSEIIEVCSEVSGKAAANHLPNSYPQVEPTPLLSPP
jgi:hypothetical protein